MTRVVLQLPSGGEVVLDSDVVPRAGDTVPYGRDLFKVRSVAVMYASITNQSAEVGICDRCGDACASCEDVYRDHYLVHLEAT